MKNEFNVIGNTVCITLKGGEKCLIDLEDLPKVDEAIGNYYWYLSKDGYVKGGQITEESNILAMHRVVMDTPKGLVVDHINHLKWDNRKENLKNCTKSDNDRNKLKHSELIKLGVKKANGNIFDEPTEPLMTNKEIMDFLQINEKTLYDYRKQGMPVIKLSKRTFRYDKNKVLKWFEEQNKK